MRPKQKAYRKPPHLKKFLRKKIPPPHAESETELTEATLETDPVISDEEIPETETEAPSQPHLIWENNTYRITVSPADGSEFPAGFYFDALTLDDFGYAAEEQDTLYDGFLTSAMEEMAAELNYPEEWAESEAAKTVERCVEPLFMNVINADSNQVHGEYCYEIQIADPALLDGFLQGTSEIRIFEYDDNLEAGIVGENDFIVSQSDSGDGILLSFLSEDEIAAVCVFDTEKLYAEPETEAVFEAESESEVMSEVEVETETELETEAESETETETEAETMFFSYEDDTVSITATAEASTGLPAGAVLKADALEEGSDAYNEAMSLVKGSLDLAEGQEFRFAPYDVYFEFEGERIEPQDGTVHIEMEFKGPVFEEVDGVEPEETFVSHIKDSGEVEHLENTAKEEQEVAFDVASFSIMGPVEVMSLANEEEAYAILYSNGTMVFQRGDTPDPSMGEVIRTYKGVETVKYISHGNVPWYSDRGKIQSVIFKDVIRPISTAYWFFDCDITSCDLTNLDTSNVTDMGSMFYQCIHLTSLDVSGFDTGNVTRMSSMFWNCRSLTSLDLSGFDTGNVTNMNSMFERCSSLTSLDLSGFDTGNVTNMSSMFSNCSSLTSLDVSEFDTGNVTDMGSMFWNCSSLTSLDLSGFNMENVKDKRSMLDCRNLSEIILGKQFTSLKDTSFPGEFWIRESTGETFSADDLIEQFDGSTMADTYIRNDAYAILYENGTMVFQRGDTPDPSMGEVVMTYTGFETSSSIPWDMTSKTIKSVIFKDVIRPISTKSWFDNCTRMTSCDLKNLDTSNVTDMSYMFTHCGALTSLDLSSFDTKNVTNMYCMFNYCSSLTSLDLSGFDTGNVTKMDSMFDGCSRLTSLDLSGFDTGNVISMISMFEDCTYLESLDLSGFNTKNVISMYRMFCNCQFLTSLYISDFNTENVTNMEQMFNYCRSLTSLDVSGFKTENVPNMNKMFYNCSRLTSLDVSGFDTGNVTSMNSMFYGCSSLTSLDVSGFETQNVTNMGAMFYNCSRLTSLDVSGFDTGNVASMNSMFYYCDSLTFLDLSGFDIGNVTGMGYMLYRCDGLFLIKLGKEFSFVSDPKLPDNNWMRASTHDIYTSDELWSTYDGATMADTYGRKIKTNPLKGKLNDDGLELYMGMEIHDLDELLTATKRHAEFDGWYTAAVGGEKLDAGSTVNQMTYYAHYIDDPYTLVLKANGPEAEDIEVSLTYAETYQLSDQAFAYDGYVLTGWNTRKDGNGTGYGANEAVLNLCDEKNGTIILYAQWTPESEFATVSFDTQDGVEIEPITVKKGTGLTEKDIPIPAKENHTFLGWHIGAVNGEKLNLANGITVEEDVTLFAEWVEDPIVIFITGIGDPIQKRVKYSKTIGELPSFGSNANSYMKLIGWFTEASGGAQITETTTVTEDITYYARWGWTPKFNTNGGRFTGDADYPIQEDSNYTIASLPAVERDGYRLTGWFLADGVTPVNDGDTVDLSKGIEIVAHWERSDTITVTLDYNNGSGTVDTLELYIGAKLSGLPQLTRSGYTFLGWADADGSYYDGTSVAGTEDLQLTAQWEENSCTLTFNPGDGSMNSSSKTKKVPAGTTLQTLPGAKLSQYILEGWYTEEDGQGEKLTTETVITESRTYYAYYVPFLEENEDSTYAYVFGAEWSNASNANVDNVNNNLEFHPTTKTNQTATLHIRFELNDAIEDTEDVNLPIGAVKIRIPKYVWKNWDEENTGTNNLSANLPKWPDVRNGMFFSYMEDGDDYILINSVELYGGAGVDVSISYNVDPSVVPGGAKDVNGNYVDGYDFYKGTVPVTVTIDRDEDGVPETTDSKELTLEMHTSLQFNVGKSVSGVYYKWLSSWGEKPADADDYFYISWGVRESTSSCIQALTSTLSEDTVHDGTLVCWGNGKQEAPTHSWSASNTSYSSNVIMKYPISLLADIPEEGLTLTNEVIMNVIWKSGYKEAKRASASITLYDAQYPDGEFSKRNTSNSMITRNGGQEDILDDKDTVELGWYLTYDGSSHNTPVTWDEINQEYQAEPRTIVMTDGEPGDVMYSSGLPSAKYVWEPETGNIPLMDSDYRFYKLAIQLTERDAKQMQGKWIGDLSTHSEVSDYEGIDIYLRYQNTENFVFYKTVYAPSVGGAITVNLPDGVVGYQLRHRTSFYATTLQVLGYSYLLPSARVQALIQEDVDQDTTSIIKNKSDCVIYDEAGNAFFNATNYAGGNNPANKEIYELNTSTTYQYTRKYAGDEDSTIFDVKQGTQDNPMYIAGYNYNNSGRRKQVKTGVFYDLLPEGTTVDTDTIFGIPLTGNSSSVSDLADRYDSYKGSSSRIPEALYDVRFITDWQGSGRTMMVIRFTAPEGVNATGMQFWYMLHNTYENVRENGTTVENDVAFVNTTEGAVRPYSLNGTQSTISQAYREYYDSLQTENEGFISYAKDSTNYIPVDAFSWGFVKTVKTDVDYEQSSVIIPNNEYTYRLTYTQSDYAESSDIVFFDILEGGVYREEQSLDSGWHGVLKSVDVSGAASKLTDGSSTVHCQPVVYYSTKDRGAFTGADYDVTNAATWTTERPEDASTITAIAVDCTNSRALRNFVMKGLQVIDIYITMTAPTDEEFYGKTTYNEGVIYARKDDALEPTPEYSDTAVTLENTDPIIHKKSDPETGTKESPARAYIDSELTYTLSVTNEDERFTLHDILVEDTLPDGLNIDTSNIMVHFGDPDGAVKLSVSPRVSPEKIRAGARLYHQLPAAGGNRLPGDPVPGNRKRWGYPRKHSRNHFREWRGKIPPF